MNEAVKLEQVKKSCKTTAKVAKIFMIIIIVLAAICLAGAILCYVYRNQINTGIREALADENSNITVDFDTNLSFGSFSNLSFDLEEMEKAGEYGELCTLYCSLGTVALIFTAVVLGFVHRIFETINESETPFTEEVNKKLKTFFIVGTVLSVLTLGLGIGALIGLCCWCLYTIFEYGYVLQKQIDETL